jgi:hypothetical protein
MLRERAGSPTKPAISAKHATSSLMPNTAKTLPL